MNEEKIEQVPEDKIEKLESDEEVENFTNSEVKDDFFFNIYVSLQDLMSSLKESKVFIDLQQIVICGLENSTKTTLQEVLLKFPASFVRFFDKANEPATRFPLKVTCTYNKSQKEPLIHYKFKDMKDKQKVKKEEISKIIEQESLKVKSTNDGFSDEIFEMWVESSSVMDVVFWDTIGFQARGKNENIQRIFKKVIESAGKNIIICSVSDITHENNKAEEQVIKDVIEEFKEKDIKIVRVISKFDKSIGENPKNVFQQSKFFSDVEIYGPYLITFNPGQVDGFNICENLNQKKVNIHNNPTKENYEEFTKFMKFIEKEEVKFFEKYIDDSKKNPLLKNFPIDDFKDYMGSQNLWKSLKNLINDSTKLNLEKYIKQVHDKLTQYLKEATDICKIYDMNQKKSFSKDLLTMCAVFANIKPFLFVGTSHNPENSVEEITIFEKVEKEANKVQKDFISFINDCENLDTYKKLKNIEMDKKKQTEDIKDLKLTTILQIYFNKDIKDILNNAQQVALFNTKQIPVKNEFWKFRKFILDNKDQVCYKPFTRQEWDGYSDYERIAAKSTKLDSILKHVSKELKKTIVRLYQLHEVWMCEVIWVRINLMLDCIKPHFDKRLFEDFANTLHYIYFQEYNSSLKVLFDTFIKNYDGTIYQPEKKKDYNMIPTGKVQEIQNALQGNYMIDVEYATSVFSQFFTESLYTLIYKIEENNKKFKLFDPDTSFVNGFIYKHCLLKVVNREMKMEAILHKYSKTSGINFRIIDDHPVIVNTIFDELENLDLSSITPSFRKDGRISECECFFERLNDGDLKSEFEKVVNSLQVFGGFTMDYAKFGQLYIKINIIIEWFEKHENIHNLSTNIKQIKSTIALQKDNMDKIKFGKK